MQPQHEAFIILTRSQFPELGDTELDLEAIVKGGSDRHFYRIFNAVDQSRVMILMVYTMARSDNPKFVPATRRLAKRGVHVPKILAFDSDKLCVWLEDLGREDLHSRAGEPWEIVRPLYEATLREGAKIHAIVDEELGTRDIDELEPAFDEALYKWEQDYFLGHYVRDELGKDTTAAEFGPAHQCLRQLRRTLGKLPRCLVHRDFQSQNVMVRGSEVALVDYQGLRLGLAEYDVASLLYDPYVNLTQEQRDELLDYYVAHRKISAVECRRRLHLCAAQRLMQALGAYGNLSRNQGKPHFRKHMPAAVANLTTVCDLEPSLAPLKMLFFT